MFKFLLFWFLSLISINLEAAFERLPGLMEYEFNFLTLHPFNDEIIYASSIDSLYRRDESGNWQLIYKVTEGKINFIYPDPSDYSLLFIACDNGLIMTRDLERFEYIFRARAKEIKCYCLKRIGNRIYLGSSSGLYEADVAVYDFKKVETLPENLSTYWIESNSDFIFLATDSGVYRSKDFKSFERTFIVTKSEERTLEELEDETDLEISRNMPTVLKTDLTDCHKIYLATSDGLFVSQDSGQRFIKTYLQGLPDTKINFILQDKNEPEILYLATEQGFFKTYLARGVAIKVYEGLPTNQVYTLAMDNKGKIYLATSKGIFIEGEDSRENLESDYQKLLSREPSFREIQEAALKYNEVSPEKIRAWRRSLRYRALFPAINLGYDKTVSVSTNPDYKEAVVGPRDWSLSFSWDIANLIWNSYQDDIDTRSRLNTQLRLDILEEVNRLYFERRRVKLELLTNPPKDDNEYIKKLMYLEELTAALDAYTGGYFSKRLEELKLDR